MLLTASGNSVKKSKLKGKGVSFLHRRLDFIQVKINFTPIFIVIKHRLARFLSLMTLISKEMCCRSTRGLSDSESRLKDP